MTKLWQVLLNKTDPDWRPGPVPAWGPGAWADADSLWSWRSGPPPVSMWQPPLLPAEEADQAFTSWGTSVMIGRAQRRLGEAIRQADRPVPCLEPGPNLWLSEQVADRRRAMQLCQGCPVITECAAVATADPLGAWGVFGGRDYSDDAAGEAEWLDELHSVGRMPGRKAQSRRDELLVRLAAETTVPTVALARTGSVSEATAYRVLNRNGITGPRGQEAERAPVKRRRRTVSAAEVAGLDGPILAELRALGRPPLGAVGDAARLRRDELLVELRDSDPGLWSMARLAAVAVMTPDGARSALRRQRSSGEGRRPRLVIVGREAEAQQRRLATAKRFQRLAGEVAAHAGDPRVKRLRLLTGTISRGRKVDPLTMAERLAIIAALWTDDPRFWTGERLSVAMGLGSASASNAARLLRQIRQSVAASSVEGRRYA